MEIVGGVVSDHVVKLKIARFFSWHIGDSRVIYHCIHAIMFIYQGSMLML